MSTAPQRHRVNWKIILIMLLVSAYIHLDIILGLSLLGIFDALDKETPVEISLISEEKPPPMPEPAPDKKESASPRPVTPQPTPPTPPAQPPKESQKPHPKHERQQSPPPPTPKEADSLPSEEPMQGPPDPLSPPPTKPNASPVPPQQLITQMNWGMFERHVGDEMREQREHYHDTIQQKKGGGYKFGQMTEKVRLALNNNQSWIANAPQAPKGTKATVFRNYLDATHDRIHELFADSFLPSLVSLGPGHPLNDFKLMTLIEFRIQPNGAVEEIRVLTTSGQSVFDAGAVDAIYRASPYLPPPENIRSYDGNTYFRWGFYRNQRKCGTFNATGYILTGPGQPIKPLSLDDYRMADDDALFDG